MFYNLPRPTIIAHRGASAHAPENTLAAFNLALSQSADAIELDAKLSSDGQVVVIHDQTVERTTDGKGWVHQLSLAEIKELDAGAWFDSTFRGEKIPTLGEVFESVGDKTVINIELTNYASSADDLPVRVTDLVSKYNLKEHIVFSSFNLFTLLRAHRILPEVPCGLLVPGSNPGIRIISWLSRIIPCQSLHPNLKNINSRLINDLHRRGKRVLVYTVNDPEAMRTLAAWEVDGFFTDDPALARLTLFS